MNTMTQPLSLAAVSYLSIFKNRLQSVTMLSMDVPLAKMNVHQAINTSWCASTAKMDYIYSPTEQWTQLGTQLSIHFASQTAPQRTPHT